MASFTDYLGQRGVGPPVGAALSAGAVPAQQPQMHRMPDGSMMAGPPMGGSQGQGQGQGQAPGFGPFVAQLLAALAARQQQQQQPPSYQMGRMAGQAMGQRRQ